MATKANTYRVYLNDDLAAVMARICDKTELGQSELLTKIVASGLRAIEANSDRITLPLVFKLSETHESDSDNPRYPSRASTPGRK